MSYILDALRKSEAARRSREAPDLLAQAAAPVASVPQTPPSKYANRPAWAVAALGVIALAVALWLQFGRHAGDLGPAAADSAVSGVRASANDGPDAGPDTSTTQAGSGLDQDAASANSPAAGVDITDDASPTHSGASLDPGNSPGVMPGMAPGTPPVTMPQPVPPAPVRQLPALATGPSAQPAPPPTAAANRSAAILPPSGIDDSPVALADIAPELRRQLPPLRMSMHLWNESPERRLLVLDGQRLRQGDVLGELVVERINRDGAVLAWRGARIALPAE